MLQPKKRKYRKDQKGRNKGLAFRGNTLSFGDFGLKSIQHFRLTARQIEAARRAITHHLKRVGRVWIRIYPDKPISKKPLEVRQGKGKGSVEYWVAMVKPGTILFEVGGVSRNLALEALRRASAKLPVQAIVEERQVTS